jgi:GTP cyclohydrolase I
MADEIQRVTASDDVMVVGEGQHRCMSMRGIKTDAMMSNSVVRGRFRDVPAFRAEALSLMGG